VAKRRIGRRALKRKRVAPASSMEKTDARLERLAEKGMSNFFGPVPKGRKSLGQA
jgi:hypothetical protein